MDLKLFPPAFHLPKNVIKKEAKNLGIELMLEGVVVNPLNLIDYDYAHTLIQWSIIHFYCSSIELQKIT